MKNFKDYMKTEDFVNSITHNVEKAIESYKANHDIWRTYVTIAKYQVNALCYQGFSDDAVFSQAWDELMNVTGFNKLYSYQPQRKAFQGGSIPPVVLETSKQPHNKKEKEI